MKRLVYILALLPAVMFMGCQISYVKTPRGETAGAVTVYQGFSRSAVGGQNTVDAASTKTSAILTASINPELNSEINPSLSSEINPALSAAMNPSIAGNSAEINPELESEFNPVLDVEISDLYNGAATVESEPVEEEEVPTITETEE